MFCKNCGNELKSDEKFCNSCGTVNDGYVETPVADIPATEEVPTDNTFMNTQPFSIDEVAQKVEDNKEVTPAVEPAPVAQSEPVVEAPSAPIPEAPAAGVVEPTPVTPVMNAAPAPKKKNNIVFIILVIVLGLIIVGLGVFIAIKFIKPADKKTPTNEPKVTEPTTPTEPTKPTEPTPITDDATTYKMNGYKFTIPTGYTKDSDQGVDIMASNKFMFGYMSLANNTTYADTKTDWASIVASHKYIYEAKGATYVTDGEYTYGDTKFLIISYINYGVYDDLFVTSLPDGTLLIGEAAYNSVSDKATGYADIAKFAKSAKADTNGSFASSPINISERELKLAK